MHAGNPGESRSCSGLPRRLSRLCFCCWPVAMRPSLPLVLCSGFGRTVGRFRFRSTLQTRRVDKLCLPLGEIKQIIRSIKILLV